MIGTALLTGAGGDIAQSIARLLRRDGLAARLVGADCREGTAARAFFDQTLVLPPASDESYFDRLRETALACKAEVLFPLSEAELAEFLALGVNDTAIGGALPICANSRALEAGLDKWCTQTLLADAGLDLPASGIVGEDTPPRFPVVVKPRSGQGSKRVAVCDASAFEDALIERPGDLWQEHLPEDDQEFTCGLVRFPDAGVRSLSFRRRLAGGLTGSGEVVADARITRMLERVADALDLRGAINVQLRLNKGVPMIFEINSRFSSTVGFRHALGFQDVRWSIEDRLGIPVSPYSAPAEGTQIYRVAEEVILPPLA